MSYMEHLVYVADILNMLLTKVRCLSTGQPRGDDMREEKSRRREKRKGASSRWGTAGPRIS